MSELPQIQRSTPNIALRKLDDAVVRQVAEKLYHMTLQGKIDTNKIINELDSNFRQMPPLSVNEQKRLIRNLNAQIKTNTLDISKLSPAALEILVTLICAFKEGNVAMAKLCALFTNVQMKLARVVAKDLIDQGISGVTTGIVSAGVGGVAAGTALKTVKTPTTKADLAVIKQELPINQPVAQPVGQPAEQPAAAAGGTANGAGAKSLQKATAATEQAAQPNDIKADPNNVRAMALLQMGSAASGAIQSTGGMGKEATAAEEKIDTAEQDVTKQAAQAVRENLAAIAASAKDVSEKVIAVAQTINRTSLEIASKA